MKGKLCFLFISLLFFSTVHFARASAFDDGMTAYYQKSWGDAQQDFRKALESNPNDSLALVYYIVCSYRDGSFVHEMNGLEDHLVDYPDDEQAQIQLGFFQYTRAYVRGSDPREALSQLRHAAMRGPSPLVHTGIGIIYYDLGDLTRAQKELARAMDMNPKDVLAYEYAGKILLTFANDPKDALNYFKQEAALAPDYPDGHYYLGRTFAALGQATDAVAQYEQTSVLDPLGVGRGGDARLALGDLYLRLGDYDNAEHAYRQALAIDPQNQILMQRLEKLEKERKVKQ